MSWTIKGNGTGEDLLYSQAGTPSLDLRFAATKSLNDYVSGNNLITFTRASSGTFVDSAGLLQTAATDVPRFDHNPTTGESLGLLVEEQRSNLLLNSGTLSTQSVTVTAVAHTLSFTGTGTITLTGTSTAGPLVGTGTGESNRVSLTFTPTAGSLTLTVSGTITNAQLEIGAFRTSYIATTGATATRAADVASMTGANFSSWYNQSEGTLAATFTWRLTTGSNSGYGFPWYIEQDGTNSVYLGNWNTSSQYLGVRLNSGGTTSAGPIPNTAQGIVCKTATAMKSNDFSVVSNASTPIAYTGAALASSMSTLHIMNVISNYQGNGTVARLTYFPQRLADSTLQAITQ
jgi:hypothetical protein